MRPNYRTRLGEDHGRTAGPWVRRVRKRKRVGNRPYPLANLIPFSCLLAARVGARIRATRHKTRNHTAHATHPMAEPPRSIFVRVECLVRRRRPYLVTSKAEGSDKVWRTALDLSGTSTAGSSTRRNMPVRRFAK